LHLQIRRAYDPLRFAGHKLWQWQLRIGTHMATTTLGVKLDDASRERLKRVAQSIDRTPG